jgi:N-acetylmuramoyl-L-alanine amidase
MYDVAESVNLKVRKPMPKQKFWQANLYICKNTDCPCVLTENFFMDNEAECKWLLSENGKKAVTYIHVEGIKKYITNL